MRVTGHRVLITGGSVGIGYALARAFRVRDNNVAICARRGDRLEKAAESLPGVHPFTCDVRDEGQIRKLIDEAQNAMGGISVLVNNAGVQMNDTYGSTDAETILTHADSEIGTNLTGLIKLTALAIPHLRHLEQAAVVNISSVLAIVPKKSAPVYCATKAAVHSFTKALRYQLAETAPSVRVFDVLPPGVDTEMTRGRNVRKMSADAVAYSIIDGMSRDRLEMRLGQTRALSLVYRMSPRLAHRLLKYR